MGKQPVVPTATSTPLSTVPVKKSVKTSTSLPSRDQSQKLLHTYVKNEALVHHVEMVAAALESYAKALGEDPELWYATGLLHDLDWEKFPDEHPNKALAELLHDYPAELHDAIAEHAPNRTGKYPSSLLANYLFASDELSGFINAYSLMRKGFAGMEPGSVLKKLKDKAFAKNVSREDIQEGFALIGKSPEDHVAFLISVFQKI